MTHVLEKLAAALKEGGVAEELCVGGLVFVDHEKL